jgi:DNA repair protein RadC
MREELNIPTSNADLFALLLGTSAAQALCLAFPSLSELAKATEEEIKQHARVSARRARQARAALALARRLSQEAYADKPLLDTPELVANLLREENRAYSVENFQVVLLNTRRRLIRVERISQGTLDTILVHPREVFKSAISANAAAVVLAHNHPSGDPTPSESDIRITRDLIRAGQLLKIEVLDHVIIGHATQERPKDYVSLRELGYFCS